MKCETKKKSVFIMKTNVGNYFLLFLIAIYNLLHTLYFKKFFNYHQCYIILILSMKSDTYILFSNYSTAFLCFKILMIVFTFV